jgi:peptide/nickel transport system ATP-binding protein
MTVKFEADGLSRVFGHGKRERVALDRVSFQIHEEEIVSLVGQSGCGKTVLAKLMLRLDRATSGKLLFNGRDIDAEPRLVRHFRQVQAVFQDPFSAFSGGQMQRMLLARIFIIRPEVLIADEPTSMVDACSRASILDYLMKLKNELRMTIVFVTHDLGLACYVSDTLYIMHQGQIVERGPPERVVGSPESPITRQLLDDIPDIHRDWLGRSG